MNKTQICNRALSEIGDARVYVAGESSRHGTLIDTHFDAVVEEVLREHDWSSAKKRVTLAASSTAPVHTWTKAYALPSDFVRIVQVNDGDEYFEIEGEYILCNEDSLELVYIFMPSDDTGYSRYSSELAEVVALKLATVLAPSMVGDANRMDALRRRYEKRLIEARSTDSIQSRPAPPDHGYNWINTRQETYWD